MGAVRAGKALLVGLLRCGYCGHKLYVSYWGKSGTSATYRCRSTLEAGGTDRRFWSSIPIGYYRLMYRPDFARVFETEPSEGQSPTGRRPKRRSKR